MTDITRRLTAGLLPALVCINGVVRAQEKGPTTLDPAAAIELRAGPVRLKLQDGQLRYLRVGDREIVRRVYFAVRDGTWATIPPRFTRASIQQASDSFEVNLTAECRRDPVDYTWTGQIKGTPDGKITYHAEGVAGGDFQSNRIGLCVLFGLPSLAEQAFETFDSADGAGTPTAGRFPTLVSPDLVGKKFRLLRYKSPEGYQVSCSLEGAIFDMEDQRNWGDSSFKAYAPLPYAYPSVAKGQKLDQTITLAAQGITGLDAYHDLDTVHIRIGEPIAGARVPKVVELTSDKSFDKAPSFVEINHRRDKYAIAKEITWSYTSATHLGDDDTLMENPPALVDQAATLRSLAPQAALRVGPIQIDRPDSPIATAWRAEVLACLARAGVDEARFKQSATDAAIADIAAHAGAPLLKAGSAYAPGCAKPAWAVQALAIKDGDATIVWLINRTSEKARAVVDGLGVAPKVVRLNPPNGTAGGTSASVAGGPAFQVDLDPYGVYRIDSKR